MEISRKGDSCERVGAAEIIVTDLDKKNKEVVPILADLAKGRSIFSSEEDLLCRRNAALLLAWSPEGIRILTRFLKDQDLFLRRGAMFAFYEKGSHFSTDTMQAWKDAIPFIVEATRDKDEQLSTAADEVLDRMIESGGAELSSAAKKSAR
jgi:HEAT repeat protein